MTVLQVRKVSQALPVLMVLLGHKALPGQQAPREQPEMTVQQARKVSPALPVLMVLLGHKVLRVQPVRKE